MRAAKTPGPTSRLTGTLSWKLGIGSFDHRLQWKRFSLALVKSKAEGGALVGMFRPTAILAHLPCSACT